MLYLHSAGVEREYSIERHLPNDERWIRMIKRLNLEHFIIVCCTFQQAKAFAQATAIEIDLSFKMVAGNINLFSISGWDDDAKRKLNICPAYIKLIVVGLYVYAYAFTNKDTRFGYFKLFTFIFQTLAEVSRQPVKFWHIHQAENSIRTIGLDMCKKQARGKHILCICETYTEHIQALEITFGHLIQVEAGLSICNMY
jgi:hypothetical protein